MSGDYVFPLPQNLEPTKFRCVTFYVPDEVDWYMSFWGWLYEMGYGKRYQKNPTKDGVRVAAVWQKVIDDGRVNFLKRLCEPPVDRGDEFEEDMNLCDNIRFENGVLQVKCCGEWQPVDGQPTQGTGGGSQPGESPQPTDGGGCQDYQGNMGGAAPWYVPTTVNSGDTIHIHDMSGIFYNASQSRWFCPDGSYFLITCTGLQYFDSGAQLPGTPTGKLIAKIGSVYYDIQPGPFTVPGGHTNDPVQLEMNTGQPSGSGGNVAFTVTVCNNQQAAWTHTFDSSTNPYSSFFTIDTTGQTVVTAPEWSPSDGGYKTGVINFAGVNWYHAISLKCIKPATYTQIQVSNVFTPGPYNGNTVDNTFQLDITGVGTVMQIHMPTTPPGPAIWTGSQAGSGFEVTFNASWAPTSDPGSGEVIIPRIVVSGVGPDPFV